MLLKPYLYRIFKLSSKSFSHNSVFQKSMWFSLLFFFPLLSPFSLFFSSSVPSPLSLFTILSSSPPFSLEAESSNPPAPRSRFMTSYLPTRQKAAHLFTFQKWWVNYKITSQWVAWPPYGLSWVTFTTLLLLLYKETRLSEGKKILTLSSHPMEDL